jgi:hypothetical protein
LKQEQREVSDGELIIPNRLYAFFASEGLLSGKLFSARAGTLDMREPTEEQKKTLVRATEFCRKHYDINIDPNTVSVARMADKYGNYIQWLHHCQRLVPGQRIQDAVKCLIEEWLHITTGAKDEDYSMHHAYLNLLLSIGNEMEAKGVNLYAN